MKKEKKPRHKGQSWIAVLLSLLLGGCAGVLLLNYLIPLGDGLSLWQKLLLFALTLFSLYAAMLLQVIIHEAGHLVFGLLTGYRFLSFRVFSLMLVREEEKLRFRRYSLAGTGGQCLMIPPELRDGTMPVLLYNFGGAILNLVAAALFFALSLLLPPSSFLRLFLRLLALAGVYYALTNGIPLHLGPVDNAVPLLIGRTQTAAQSLLWSYGFELGEVTGAYSNEYAKGQIISQDPEAGAHLEKGGKVNITVSLGPEESGDQFTVTVPKLTQQTLEDARAAITKAGLVLDQVTYQDSTTVEKDRVISQSISAGSTVDKGSKINLVVSKGIAEPRTLSIKLDYAQAKEENFRVSVTLTDQGETTNVFVEQRSRSSASDTVQITGKGENSKVTVFFSYPSGGMDAVRTYSVNFRTGEIKEQ